MQKINFRKPLGIYLFSSKIVYEWNSYLEIFTLPQAIGDFTQ